MRIYNDRHIIKPFENTVTTSLNTFLTSNASFIINFYLNEHFQAYLTRAFSRNIFYDVKKSKNLIMRRRKRC